MSIWRNRYGTHAAISSNCGRRFSGGRHLTTLQMKTRSRGSSIAPRILVSSSPRSSRSEEHTSELQSRVDLVCRLLLEKKNKPPRQATVVSGSEALYHSGCTACRVH